MRDHAPHDVLELFLLRTRQDVLDRGDEGRIADDPQLAVDGATQLGERPNAVLRPHARRRSTGGASSACRNPGPSWSRIDATSRRAYQTWMFRISAKRAIASRYSRAAAVTTARRVASVEAAIPAGNRETGGKPLHVPLEGSRQRLVEVVETEDEPPVRRGEDAEVREVRVAAELGVAIPVRGPSARSAAIRYAAAAEEGERGHQHAPVPDRAELRKTRLRLILEKIDRISAHRRRLPSAVRGAGQLGAGRLSARGAFSRGGVRHRLRRLRRRPHGESESRAPGSSHCSLPQPTPVETDRISSRRDELWRGEPP